MITELLSQLASWLPLGYAFGAGMIATVNPCGFLVLPAYIAYYLGTSEGNQQTSPVPVRALRGLALALAITIGFVVLFSIVGLAISLGGQALSRVFPVAGLTIGIALASLGLWLLFRGGSVGITAASRLTITFNRNLGNAFLFGIVYAIASLSCTLPIFLLVVGSALATEGIARSFLQFVSYSLGMASLLVVVTVSTTFFNNALNRYLHRVRPYVHKVSALFLIGAGVYLVFYWTKYGALF